MLVMDNENCLQKSSRKIIFAVGKKSGEGERQIDLQKSFCLLLSKDYMFCKPLL
jgi:hypothetical protein